VIGRRVWVVVACLAGCATGPTVLPTRFDSSPQAVSALQGWSEWRATGRLAVKSAAGGFNAHFDWHETGSATDLVVEGPFGAGHARIKATPERISVESGAAGTVELTPPFDGLNAVLTERIGFSVPLHSVGFWLRGVPDPETPVTAAAAGFVQADWLIQPEGEWMISRAPGTLPKRVTLVQDTTRIRVAIDQWTGGEP
jgi:outer membrane lipoprotein LolB